MKLVVLLSFMLSCAHAPKSEECKNPTQEVKLTKSQAEKIQGKVSQFLSDAKVTGEPLGEENKFIWRFTNMPEDSVYHEIGLRNGDGVYRTNLGEQKSSLNLISDLSGIASGTTDCLYVKTKENVEKIIHIQLEPR